MIANNLEIKLRQERQRGYDCGYKAAKRQLELTQACPEQIARAIRTALRPGPLSHGQQIVVRRALIDLARLMQERVAA